MKLLKTATLLLCLMMALPIQAARPGSFASIAGVSDQEQAEALQQLKDMLVVMNAAASVSKPQDGIKPTSIALEGDYVVWNFQIDEEALGATLNEAFGTQEERNLSTRESLADSMRENILADDEDDCFEIICVGADKGMRYNYTSKQTGKTLSSIVTPDEMVEVFFEVLQGVPQPE